MADHKKDELVRFLEQRAFNPVLNAKADGRSEADKKKLEHVQKATRAEIERFRGYGSAAHVITNFRRDLDSRPANRFMRNCGRSACRPSTISGRSSKTSPKSWASVVDRRSVSWGTRPEPGWLGAVGLHKKNLTAVPSGRTANK